jgi:hypothetical protein
MADEVIKTRFEGDAASLVTEVEKARASVKKLSAQDLPLVKSELNSAFTASQRTANSMRDLSGAARGSSSNMLVLAQVADDAQYGMRGIANQIPQLAMALGGSAGLAGVVSLAALAIWKLTPALISLYSSADPKNVIEATKEYGRVLAQNLDTLRATSIEQQRARAIADSNQSAAAAVQSQTSADPTVARIEAEIAAKARLRTAEDALIAARNRAQLSSADAGGVNTAEIQRQQLARAQDLARARAAEDAASQSALSKAAADAANNLQTSAENFAAQFKANIAAAAEEADRLKRNLAFAEAAAAQAQTEFDGAKNKSSITNEAKNLKITKQRLEAEKQLLADALAQETALRAQAAAAEAAFAAEQKAYADKSTAAAAEIMRQKESAAFREQTTAAQKQELENQLKITAAAEAKAAADKASAAAKKAAKDAELAAEKAAAQGASKADFAAELQALRLQAAGREKEATALREKSRLAKEAAALAQATGISEEKALALVREKAALEKSVTDQKERGNRGEQSNGRIKLFKRGESATTFARPGDGLAKSVIEKNVLIAENRRAQNIAAQKPDNGTSTLDDLLTVSKQQLKVWETNLGLV